jgi:hypothetical protein
MHDPRGPYEPARREPRGASRPFRRGPCLVGVVLSHRSSGPSHIASLGADEPGVKPRPAPTRWRDRDRRVGSSVVLGWTWRWLAFSGSRGPVPVEYSAPVKDRVLALLDRRVPDHRPFPIMPPLEPDESAWFVRAVDDGLVRFGECDERCPRRRRWGYVGHDEFMTPDQGRRHLFSLPPTKPRLNREYVPHIAAYAMAVLHHGYRAERSSFSRYRSFERDAITRTVGTGYETDGEFYASDGAIHLLLEAKGNGRQVAAIAEQLERARDLAELPVAVVKEVEYVVELRPRCLWVVGPGSIDPPRHVFAVRVDGRRAAFEPVSGFPPPP